MSLNILATIRCIKSSQVFHKFKMSQFSSVGSSKSPEKLKDYIKFLKLVGKLKHIKRTGWVLRDVPDPESIASHMYRMSLMPFLLDKDSSIDRDKSMKMALIHDLAEAVVGDITPYCNVSKEEKRAKEEAAMKDICDLVGPESGTEMMELFTEYEEGKSKEAKFVKDLDRLDMVLQAFEYEEEAGTPKKLQEFFDSTEGKFQHPLVLSLVNEIKAQREATHSDPGSSS